MVEFLLAKQEVEGSNPFIRSKNSYLITKDKTKIEQAQQRNNIRVLVLTETELEWNQIKSRIGK